LYELVFQGEYGPVDILISQAEMAFLQVENELTSHKVLNKGNQARNVWGEKPKQQPKISQPLRCLSLKKRGFVMIPAAIAHLSHKIPFQHSTSFSGMPHLLRA